MSGFCQKRQCILASGKRRPDAPRYLEAQSFCRPEKSSGIRMQPDANKLKEAWLLSLPQVGISSLKPWRPSPSSAEPGFQECWPGQR